MAFTNFGYFNQSTGGAPTLSGTAGDLNLLLHYAFVTISNWTRTFNTGTPTFASVWQPASGGSTPVVTCQDNAATSGDARAATMRLAESASSSTAYTDPCPTVLQVPNNASGWVKSSTASAATREYHCVVWETGLLLAVKMTAVVDQWEIYFIGKCFQRLTALQDPWPWAIWQRNMTTYTSIVCAIQATSDAPTAASGRSWIIRNAQGTLKSEGAIPEGRGATLGTVPGTSAAGSGYLNSVDYSKITMLTTGTASTILGSSPVLSRLCVPNLYSGNHGVYSGVTETDNINNGSHTLQLLRDGLNNAVILETSNTFSGFPAG